MAKQVLGNGKIKNISSSELKKDDVFIFEAGDLITTDSEIIVGLATIALSDITCESAPVIRESDSDKSFVTGAAKV
jgi:K+-transporting ATPase ATPase B chain